MALVVVLSSFVLSGLFLLMAMPSDNRLQLSGQDIAPVSDVAARLSVQDQNLSGAVSGDTSTNGTGGPQKQINIPYERNKVLRFLPAKTIQIIKADGHYTRINNGEGDLFCPWSISQMEKKLDPAEFMRTHRSFIVNKTHITGFRREGDKAFCIVGTDNGIEIPVSRSRVAEMRKILQLN